MAETLRTIGRSVSDAAEKVFSPKKSEMGREQQPFGSPGDATPKQSTGSGVSLGKEPMEPITPQVASPLD